MNKVISYRSNPLLSIGQANHFTDQVLGSTETLFMLFLSLSRIQLFACAVSSQGVQGLLINQAESNSNGENKNEMISTLVLLNLP